MKNQNTSAIKRPVRYDRDFTLVDADGQVFADVLKPMTLDNSHDAKCHAVGQEIAAALNAGLASEWVASVRPLIEKVLYAVDGFKQDFNESNFGSARDWTRHISAPCHELLKLLDDPKLTELYGLDMDDEPAGGE